MFWQNFICLKRTKKMFIMTKSVIMTKDDVDTIRNSQKYSENNKNNNKKSKNM